MNNNIIEALTYVETAIKRYIREADDMSFDERVHLNSCITTIITALCMDREGRELSLSLYDKLNKLNNDSYFNSIDNFIRRELQVQ